MAFWCARTHFREALRCNHLVHAHHRTKFIPVASLRYALLLITGAVLVVALVGGAERCGDGAGTNARMGTRSEYRWGFCP